MIELQRSHWRKHWQTTAVPVPPTLTGTESKFRKQRLQAIEFLFASNDSGYHN
jgi:hypothetical protein